MPAACLLGLTAQAGGKPGNDQVPVIDPVGNAGIFQRCRYRLRVQYPQATALSTLLPPVSTTIKKQSMPAALMSLSTVK